MPRFKVSNLPMSLLYFKIFKTKNNNIKVILNNIKQNTNQIYLYSLYKWIKIVIKTI